MANALYNARVIKDNRRIQVYKLNKGGYCNFRGCTEEFKAEELEIINEVKD